VDPLHYPSDIASCCNDRHARELPWTEDACGIQKDMISDGGFMDDVDFVFRLYRAQC
jgi:hypothetical protein